MYGLLIHNLAKIAAIVGAVVIVFGAGWKINGWRLEARISDLQASHAKAYAEAQKAAREREKALQDNADALRRQKDAKIATINSRLSSALDSLRERPSRLPAATKSCAGATGAELSREDAEFLTREAARADKAVEDLNYCIAQYNSLRR